RIADAVRLCAPAALPKRMQRQGPAIFRSPVDGLGHDGETAPDAGETAILREAAKLHGAFARARNLEDRVWDLRIANVGFVGCVEKNQRLMFARVIYPGGKLFPRGDGTRWVIGET